MASTMGVFARWSVAGLVLVLLSACGGGEPAPDASWPAPPGALSSLKAETAPSALSRLTVAAPEVVENTRSGYRWLLAVGVLDDGGHAVAWLAREAADAKAPWQLWTQRYDRYGRKSGLARQLPYSDEVTDIRQVAAVVRRDASVVVAWATLRPYQATTPGLLASSVRARHFGLDGKPLGSERVLDEVVWWEGPADAERFEDLVVAQWRDGRYLVGWTAVDAWNRISCVVQRLAATGRPLAPLDRLGPVAGRGLRLTPLEAGGWLATTTARAADGHLHASITQVDVRPPLGLPLLDTLPLRSFVMDLDTQGRLLLAGLYPHDAPAPAAPWSLWFNPTGREADRTRPLPALPTQDVALADGTWIGLWPHDAASRLWAQRFDAQGAPLGAPVLTYAARAARAVALPGGGALIAWVGQGPDSSAGTNVFIQRLTLQP